MTSIAEAFTVVHHDSPIYRPVFRVECMRALGFVSSHSYVVSSVPLSALFLRHSGPADTCQAQASRLSFTLGDCVRDWGFLGHMLLDGAEVGLR